MRKDYWVFIDPQFRKTKSIKGLLELNLEADHIYRYKYVDNSQTQLSGTIDNVRNMRERERQDLRFNPSVGAALNG